MLPSAKPGKVRLGILFCTLILVIVGTWIFYHQANGDATKLRLLFGQEEASDSDIQIKPFSFQQKAEKGREVENSYGLELRENEGKVYLYDNEIDGADLESIKALSEDFLADRNAVYEIDSLTASRIDGLRPENIDVLYQGYPWILVNDTQLYFTADLHRKKGHLIDFVPQPLKLRVIDQENRKPLILGDGTNLYIATRQHFIRFPTESPKLINSSFYIKGGDEIFYQTDKIVNADAETFEIVEHPTAHKIIKGEPARIFYARDAKNVYYKGKRIPEADPRSFKVYDVPYYQEYAHDDMHVYIDGEVIIGADPATFTVLKKQPYEGCGNGTFGKDKNAVYYRTNKIEGADVDTFEPLSLDYARDAQKSFWRDLEIPIPPQELKDEDICFYG